MKLFSIFLLIILLSSCTKSDSTGNCIPEDITWINKLKAEYASCVCIMALYTGTYQGQQVIESRSIDPLCCFTINSVYKIDGTVWFNSTDQAYQQYLSSVQQLRQFWKCSDGK